MIQQTVSFQISIHGDGATTQFTFDLGRVYGLSFPPSQLGASGNPADFVALNPDAIPDGVRVDYAAQLPGPTYFTGVTASISRRAITITLDSPRSGDVVVGLSCLFNG